MKAINLIPAADRRQGIRLTNLSVPTLLLIGVLCAAVVAVASLVVVDSRTENRRAEVVEVHAQTAANQAKLDSLSGDTTLLARLERSSTAAQSLLGSRYNWPALIGGVTTSLPALMAMDTINGQLVPSAGATGSNGATVTETGPSLHLSGCTTSLPRLATAMDHMRGVNGVKSVVLNTTSLKTENNSSDGADKNECPYIRTFEITLALSASAATNGATS